MFKIIRKEDYDECESDELKLHHDSVRKIVRTMRKEIRIRIKRFNNGNETIKKIENL